MAVRDSFSQRPPAEVFDTTLAELFASSAARNPQSTAVVFEGTRLTYRELDTRASRLARLLARSGVGPEHIVGVALPRSLELVTTLLAIHKAGAAYLPLDTDYPPDRLAFMVSDAAPIVVVTTQGASGCLPPGTTMVVVDAPDTVHEMSVRPAAETHLLGALPDHPAYVIYTSGSTGRPKGVVVSHRSIVNRLLWMQAQYCLTPGERVLQKTPSSFDVSVWEFFWPLIVGATLVVAKPGGHKDPAYLGALIGAERVTTLHFVPSMLQVFLAQPAIESGASLRRVICSGEALRAELRDRFFAVFGVDGPELHNLYGPTEAAVDVTWWPCGAGEQGPVPIGHPVWNTTLRVLDDRLRPTAAREAGELYLAGMQLARGYLNRPGVTAERFVADPFGPPGSRMYRTGDLARRRDDGALEYLGRVDHQVKIRGFRVELGEIEAALNACPGVAEAVVTAREIRPGDTRLVAYLVSKPGGDPTPEDVRAHLAARLPEHMVPVAFVQLDAMPLSANGKLDRKALPAPDFAAAARYRPPRNAREELVCSLFADVLGVTRVGTEDGFFTLGGDSILAMRLAARLRAAGLACAPQDVFEHRTPERLAEALADAGDIDDSGELLPPVADLELGADAEDVLPLGPLQEGLLYHARVGRPGGVGYIVQLLVDLDGDVDGDRLRAAARALLRRHSGLRAAFRYATDGIPVQVVTRDVAVPWRDVDLRGTADDDGRWARAGRIADEDRVLPFDVTEAPLLRLSLLRLGDRRFRLVVTVHHLVVDGWSLPILVRELCALYAGDDVPPTRPYRDYLAWVSAQDREAAVAEWKAALAGVDAPTRISAGDLTETAAAPEHVTDVCLDDSLTMALSAFARERGLTVNTVLQGAWAIVLGLLTGRDDVVFGAAVSGRPAELTGVETMVGLFINTIPVRVRLRRAEAIATMLDRLQKEQARLIAHHHLSPAEMQSAAGVGDLFDTVVVFENYPVEADGPRAAGEFEVTGTARRDATHYPLSLTVVPGNPMALRVAYRPEGIQAHLAEGIGGWLTRVLAAIVADPQRPVAALDLLGTSERSRLLESWNDTARDVPAVTLVESFEARARARPCDVAVAAGATRLSYAEVNERADRLAHLLVARGAGPEDVVALVLPRTEQFIIGLLAVLKSGAAALPLSPDDPRARIAFQLSDAGATHVLAAGVTAAALPEGCRRIVVDEPHVRAAVDALPVRDPTDLDRIRPLRPDNPAYVIYTSGSTGAPKGVVVPQRALANLFHTQLTDLISPEAARAGGRRLRAALVASVAFDAFWEPVLWMVAGHEVHVVDERVRLDPEALVRYVRTERIDVLDVTPSHLSQLVAAGLLSGEEHRPAVVTFGGEPAGSTLWSRLRDAEAVGAYNYYGPTEFTVDALCCPVGDGRSPVIGRPMGNVRAYVLDPGLQPVPDGVAGELYLAGVQMARGYLGRPAPTAERFVADPFGAPGERMYRTGDVVRRPPDGRFEYLGRVDDQVKIRGFRVELGEIEGELLRHPGVASAAVVADSDGGLERLIAYVVPRARDGVAPEELRRSLGAALPRYMVPAAFVVLDELPLTARGKLDRGALPRPEFVPAGAGRAPRNAREQMLCDLFADVLGVGAVTIDDDFFALGGHSLLAVRLVARIRRLLNVDVAVRTLFDAPTVAGLAGLLDGARSGLPPLRAAPRPDELPLSLAQQRLWFLHQLEGPSPTYNVPFALRLLGAIDVAALRAAMTDVMTRHDTLRTVFGDEHGRPVQHVLPADRTAARLVECDAGGDLDAALMRAARHSFDLAAEPPLRAWLFRVSAEEHVLLVLLHHIAADEWSMTPLARDLSTAYAARRRGRPPEWPPLPVQYADYTLWQRELLGDADADGGGMSHRLRFWTDALRGLPEQLDLPTDRPRPAAVSYRGAGVPFRIPAELHARMRAVARREGVTVFMVLHAGLAAVLTRLGAGTDIPIGAPVAGRSDDVLDELVGFFVNTLVLRTDTSGNPTFAELLGRVRRVDLAAYEHQEVPFERVVDALNPARSLARHPLFQVMLVHRHRPDIEVELPGVRAEPMPIDAGVARVDLTFFVAERPRGSGIDGFLEYSSDLFDRATAEALVRRLVGLLGAATTEPARRLSELDVLLPDERERLVGGGNDVTAPRPDGTLTELIAAQAAATPHATAVVYGDVELTYARLEERAEHVAALLRARGAGPERIVAVAVPRSADMVVALLAVLKSGAAYLPLDLDYPAERIAFMLHDAAPMCVLTTGAAEPRLPRDGDVPRLLLDALPAGPGRPEPDARAAARASDNAAYVIYTSGSTGRPKGVVVIHGALVGFLLSMQDRFALGDRDRMLAITTIGFDIAALELYLPLLCGAAVVVADTATVKDPPALLDLVRRAGVSAIQATPTLWEALLADASPRFDGVRMLVGGEALPAPLADAMCRAGGDVTNLYGPTETTVWSSAAEVRARQGTPPIGGPIRNTQLFVVDAALKPVATGVAGELYIGGAGLARGYLGRPGLTAERFVADPFGAPGTRMYRTGDVVRRRSDGELEFVGRADHQMKVRGFRIEPGEIEGVLGAHPLVGEARVVLRDDGRGGRQLVAYVVAKGPERPPATALRDYLGARLPDYMIPAAFVPLDELPLTPNGKLDRAALPAPDFVTVSGRRAPRTPAERALATIFAEVLRLPEVGVGDSFFELGGDSIASMRVVSRCREAGLFVTVRHVFEHKTVEALARNADATGGVAGFVSADRPLVPVTREELDDFAADLGSGSDGRT